MNPPRVQIRYSREPRAPALGEEVPKPLQAHRHIARGLRGIGIRHPQLLTQLQAARVVRERLLGIARAPALGEEVPEHPARQPIGEKRERKEWRGGSERRRKEEATLS